MHVRLKSGAMALLSAIIISVMAAPTNATLKTMRNLTNAYSDGAYPVGALANISGTLYGVTQYGTNGYGSLYKMTTAGATKTIYEFTGAADSPSYPLSGPTAVGTTLYGTSYYGGASNAGTIYKITTSGAVTILHSFTNTSTDGGNPVSGLTLDSSKPVFYGTTFSGGINGLGTMFSINVDGTNYQMLHAFSASHDSVQNPAAALCEGSDHRLYGSGTYGSQGVLYYVNKDGTGINEFVAPTSGGGSNQLSDLVKGTDNKIYGTGMNNGLNGLGTVFRFDAGLNYEECSFDGYNGAYPADNYNSSPQIRLTVGAGNTLYGVTRFGGMNGLGTIFKVDGAAFTISSLASFTQTTSNSFPNPLTLIGTTLYGTSFYGGMTATIASDGSSYGFGSAYSCTASGTFKSLHSFFIQDGYGPTDAPTAAISNYLYGTTPYGGLAGTGTVYKINTTGAFAYTILHSFNTSEGTYPVGGLYKAADGALYGCTTGGGLYGYGTIYKITTTGTFSVIHHFHLYEGQFAYRKLVQGYGADKNLYGICYSGAAGNVGSIFKVSTSGAFALIHHFSNFDGQYPGSQLTVAPDTTLNTTKYLYGMTYQGGANALGTMFRVNQTGSTFQVVHNFAGAPDGANAGYYNGSMYLSSTGVLYGTTYQGGNQAGAGGGIFKYDTVGGTFAMIHSFDNTLDEGNVSYGGLVSDGSGNLYGTMFYGADTSGTIWKYNVAGDTLTLLHLFSPDGSDGAGPYGVIFDPSGLLYGTTSSGGTAANGTIFSQTLAP